MLAGAPQLIRRAFLCAALTSVVIPATAQADLVFSPDATPVSFGNTTVMSATERMLTLTNTSTSTAVNINGMLISGPGANHFSIGPSLCPPTLGPSANCNFTVRFNPSQTGTFSPQRGVQPEVRDRADKTRPREARQGAVQGRAHLHGDRAHPIHREPPGAGRSYLVQGRTQRLTLPRERPVSVQVPRGVPGTLSKMIVTARATAPGYAAGKQRKILRLEPAKSRGRSR